MFLTKKFFYAIFLMSFVLLTSCNKDEEDNDDPQPAIVGTWSLTKIDFTFDDMSARDFIDQYFKEQGQELTDEELDAFEETLNESFEEEFNDGSTFEFKSNGTMIVDMPEDENDEQGTWQMPNSNTLIMNDGSDAAEFMVKSLTGSQMILAIEGEEPIFEGSDETVRMALNLSFTKR